MRTRISTCGATWAALVASSALAAVFALGTGAAHAALIDRAPITLSGDGPYHRLVLPLSIHGRAASADLGDLRIYNGSGQTVPFAWLHQEASAAVAHSQQVPLFALPAAVGGANGVAAADAVFALKLQPNGSLAWSVPANARSGGVAADWIIDASKVEGNLLQARFTVAAGTEGLLRFTLEASDDLRQWHGIGGEQQLVLLKQGGQVIERLDADLGRARAKFLRLHWVDQAQAARLTSVEIDSVTSVEPMPQLQWSSRIAPQICGADHCDYTLPPGLPVESLRIGLPQPNTLSQIEVAGLLPAGAKPVRTTSRNPLFALRHARPAEPLPVDAAPLAVPLRDTIVYRLRQAGGEALSPALALDGNVYVALRLRTRGPIAALGSPPPTIEVAATPRTLVFLAQGQPPFTLGWGSTWPAQTEAGAALALSTLIPGYRPTTALVADGAEVVIAPVVAAPPAPVLPAPAATKAGSSSAAHSSWLWAVMVAGLLLLGGMAWSLLGNMRQSAATPDRQD